MKGVYLNILDVAFGSQCKVWIVPCFGPASTKSGNCFLNSGLTSLLESGVVEHKRTQVARVADIFESILMGRMYWRRRPITSCCQIFLEIIC